MALGDFVHFCIIELWTASRDFGAWWEWKSW